MEDNDYQCHVCGKKLCRLQRLTTHLQRIHGIEPECSPKRYKLYKTDESSPVPKRTKIRHNLKLNEQFANSASAISCSAYVSVSEQAAQKEDELNEDDEQILQIESDGLNLQAENTSIDPCHTLEYSVASSPEDFPNVTNEFSAHEIEHNNDFLSDHEESDFSEDSQSDFSNDSSSSASLFSDEESLGDAEDTPTVEPMSENDEKCMVLLTFIMKNHLSGQASKDLLHMLKLFSDDKKGDHLPVNINKIKEIVGACDAEIIHFCDKCFTIFPKDETLYKCAQEGCNGLRYKGSENRQILKRKKRYFACLSVGQQIKDILERDGTWSALTKYCAKCFESDCISDILNAEMYNNLKKPGQFLEDGNNISLIFNTDGIPLYKSSGVSIWPVYLAINELPPSLRFSRKNMILWGVWQSCGKPVFRTFFQPFIKHMIQLKEDGVVWKLNGEERTTKAILLLGTLDLQAKAYLLDMTMFNGQHGCLTCEDEGEVVTQGRGHTRVYPYKNDDDHSTRTTLGILQCGQNALLSGKSDVGIKGVSPLLGLEWFDIVYGIVPDYMHGLLLGVTKKMLNLLFSSSNATKPYFIGRKIKLVDKILKRMKPTDQISRLPRKLESNISHLKASELQMWLLFYAIPCLIDIMSEEYVQHLALLVEGSYLLLSDRITTQQLQRADYVFSEYYREFGDLYGRNNCTLNLHNVCQHLTAYVRKVGPLWAWSCFPFEDMNGSIIQSIHGTGDVCLQVLWLVQAQKRLSVDTERMQSPDFRLYTEKMIGGGRRSITTKHEAQNCKIAGRFKLIMEDDLPRDKLRNVLNIDGEIGPVSKVLRVVSRDMILFSEEYTRMEKRIGYVVLVNSNTGMNMAAIQHFLYHHASDTCVAVVKRLEIDQTTSMVHRHVNHLIRVSKNLEIELIRVESILEKLLFLDGNKTMTCVARLPNLHGLCS